MSEKREFAVGTVLHLIVALVTILSGYAIHLWVARSLGPASYGIFGIVMAFYHIIIPFLQASFPKAASKFTAESRLNVAGVFKTALAYQVLLATVMFLLLLIFSDVLASHWFHDPSLKKYFQYLAFIIPPLSMYYLYFEGYLNGLRQFGREAYGKIFFTLLRTALVFLFVLLGFEVLGILWGYFISSIVSVIVFALWWGFPKIRDQENFSPKIITNFAILTTLSALGLMLLRNLDVLVLKSLIGDNMQLGIYTAASTLAAAPYLLFSSLGVVLFPSISKAMKKNKIHLANKYLSQSIRYLLLMFVPVAAIIAVTASNLISLVYSPAYAKAGPVLSILIFSSLFLIIFMLLLVVITSSNNPLLSMLFTFLGFVIMTASAYFFIPLFGLIGAAYASLLASAISLCTVGIYVRSKYGRFLFHLSLGRIIFCSLVIGLLAYIWQPTGLMVLTSYILLLLFYGLLLHLFGELQLEDIRLFKEVICKFLRKA